MRVCAASAWLSAPSWGLRARGSGFKNLCRILTFGNGLLYRCNVRLVCDIWGCGNTVGAIPVAIATEIQRFPIRKGECDGAVCASFELLSGQDFIAFHQ
ncbi:Uncharacterised protein [Kluyvera cryocrescens]|nr:Uncharacterised protein [Kluyvera cryocrescens]